MNKSIFTAKALLCLALLGPSVGYSALFPPSTNSTSTSRLGYWSFTDTNAWTNSEGYGPVSFTNLSASDLGDGTALVVDNTNGPVWLQYNVFESDGHTNLAVSDGSIMFWFAPSWASTNEGGTGPGVDGRLIEVGSYSPDYSSSWWSLFVDADGANLYFATQTNGWSAVTNLSVPIDWTTNRWHMISLNYSSSSNTALCIDGVALTNGPALTGWPGNDVLVNGFYIGSDSNGILQAHGMFDDLHTYSYGVNSNIVSLTYSLFSIAYYGNPVNMANLSPATNSQASTFSATFHAISGTGNLTSAGQVTGAADQATVWITNVTVTLTTNGTSSISFTIAGGSNGYPYDVFANALIGPTNNSAYQWVWEGQGYNYNRYTITNLPNASAYLRLGTPQDQDNDGLTDAYELLVSHTDPTKADTVGDGIIDGWKVYMGLNPLVSTKVQSGQESDYSFNAAGVLQGIS